jgi:hypothetical protein
MEKDINCQQQGETGKKKIMKIQKTTFKCSWTIPCVVRSISCNFYFSKIFLRRLHGSFLAYLQIFSNFSHLPCQQTHGSSRKEILQNLKQQRYCTLAKHSLVKILSIKACILSLFYVPLMGLVLYSPSIHSLCLQKFYRTLSDLQKHPVFSWKPCPCPAWEP